MRILNFIWKWGKRLLILTILFFIAVGVISAFATPGEPPDAEKALWAIQTYSNDAMRIPSRVYYASTLEFDDAGTPIISNYWIFDGKEFHKQRGSKAFPSTDYGNIDIVRRLKPQ